MSEVEKVEKLLMETAPMLSVIEGLLRTGDTTFEIKLAGDVDILADYEPRNGHLMLLAEVGKPLDDRRLKVYEAILSYGLLWRESGGVRLALAGRGGSVVQMADVFAFALEPQELGAFISNFAEKLAIFRRFIAATEDVEEHTLLSNSFTIRI